jgi:hypothetical protein
MTNVVPNAPTLAAPIGSVTIDYANVQRFSWVFSDDDIGDSQSKYELQYRVVGAGSWTTVTETTPNNFYDFAAATFTANNYEWQVRTYDALGLVGPWSSSSFFTAATAPSTLSITAPISNATVDALPTFTWSTPTQTSYQIRRARDSAGVIDTGTLYYDSGEVVDVSTRSVPVVMETSPRWEWIQVRVKLAGIWGSYVSVRVYASYLTPLPGEVTVVGNVVTASLDIATVQAAALPSRVNLMTNPSGETNQTGYVAATNCSISRVNDKAAKGSWSMKMKNTARGDSRMEKASGSPLSGSTGGAVIGGRTYTLSAYVFVTVDNRNVRIGLNWYNSGYVSGSWSANIVGTVGAWARVSATFVAPMSALWADVMLSPIAALSSEETYWDCILLEESATLGEYFDGSTTNPDYTFAWTGTAHASTSTAVPSSPAPTHIDLYIREVGTTGEGERVVAAVTPTGAQVWWTPASGKNYEVRSLTTGTNGATRWSNIFFDLVYDGGTDSPPTRDLYIDGGTATVVPSDLIDGGLL